MNDAIREATLILHAVNITSPQRGLFSYNSTTLPTRLACQYKENSRVMYIAHIDATDA